VMLLAEDDSISKEVNYLTEELHKSGRWPIVVLNISSEMHGSMYTEIHQHGSCIILISEPCEEWEQNTFGFRKQLSALSGSKLRESWNSSARFVVSFMSNCANYDTTNTSRFILSELWSYQVITAAVLFLKSNAPVSNNLQQNTTNSAQGIYLELHTWCPYENSERCNPAEGTVPVKVFTVRNLTDIRRSDVFKKCFDKNFQGCPIRVHLEINFPFVNPPKHVRYNDSYNQTVYEEGWEVELLKIIAKTLNMSLDIVSGNEENYRNGHPTIYFGGYNTFPSSKSKLRVSSRNYLTIRSAWYTPCAVKSQRWSRLFNIFSVEMWMCFALSLVLAVITVKCISHCRPKSHLQESSSYRNINSVIANIIAVSLSVSVSTQPRTEPLRLFFFCWLCYSVAISTVFQANLTTFLIEPGYEEPIRTLEDMLISDMKFGYIYRYETFFNNNSDHIASVILKDAVLCPTYETCLKWAVEYNNISTILNDFTKAVWRIAGNWTDENDRPLACELEYGDVLTSGFSCYISGQNTFLGFINDVIDHIDEGGIFTQIMNRGLNKTKTNSKLNSPTPADTYSALSISQLQTVFYLLMMGYVLAVDCFVTEIMWHRFMSKGRGPTCTSFCHGQT
jgi:hypothetical protein